MQDAVRIRKKHFVLEFFTCCYVVTVNVLNPSSSGTCLDSDSYLLNMDSAA
jgi:hypothetical protein